jgi:oligoendopeptidase F
MEAFLLVLKGFEDPSSPGAPDPDRDLAALETEFLLRDLLRVESQQGRLAEERQKGARERGAIDREAALLQRLAESLGQDRPLRGLSLTPEEERILGGWGLLSRKPAGGHQLREERAEWPLQTSLPQLSVRGKLEMEIAQLPAEEAQDFRRDYGIAEPALGRVLRQAETVMDRITFFTVSEPEVRAWMLPAGSTALAAAGLIHTDMARGFIRAEVIPWDDLLELGGLAPARAQGKLRVEGKDYPLSDGEVIYIRSCVGSWERRPRGMTVSAAGPSRGEHGERAPRALSLEDLFPGLDSPEFEQARQVLEEQVKRFESTRGELTEGLTQPRFLEILKAYEEIARVLGKIYSYGFLLFTEDTQNQKAQTAYAQVQQLVAEVNNRGLFFELWWKGLDEAASQRLMDASGDYAWLEALRPENLYTLTEPEEKLINLKDVNGVKALYNLYETITTRYTFKLEVDGQVKEMTRDELMVYVQGSDPALREAAYQEQFRVYGQDLPILGQIYQYMLRNWRSEHLDVRGFKSPIAVRNLSNDVPDEVVDTLLETCRENAPLFHRYFRLKARWLGIDRLRRYDIYAPLAQSDRTYDYSEAVDMVLESFSEFHPRVADLARRVLDERHLDGEVRKGKWGGAFSMTVTPDLTPWVLANYNRRPRDVSTLAHELGHAVHSMLAADHTALTFHATLPLAETASTFGEMLLTDRMLELDPDPAVQRLLVLHLDDLRHHPAPGLLRHVRAHRPPAGARGRLGRPALGSLLQGSAGAIRGCGGAQPGLPARVVGGAALLRPALLRVRLLLRPAAGALALPAVPAGGRLVQAALPGHPGGR